MTAEAIKRVQAIIDAIVAAEVVRIDEGPQKSPTIVNTMIHETAIGDPNNEVLFFGWIDSDDLRYNLKFTEGGIEHCTLQAHLGIIKLCDHEGDLIELQLCATVPVPLTIS